MNNDALPSSDEERNEALRQSALTSWCREQGFTLEWKAVPPENRYGYIVSRDNSQTGQRNTEQIASLAGIVPFVETMYPREWYLFWRTTDCSGTAPWCRWKRWVQVALVEGAFHPPRPNYQGDPTPYPSAKAGAAASALLGLEMGARLCLSALLTRSTGGNLVHLPTPECTPAAAEELVRDCIRGHPAHGFSSARAVMRIVSPVTGLTYEEGEAAAERLLQAGRLEWARETREDGEERRYLRVAEGETR